MYRFSICMLLWPLMAETSWSLSPASTSLLTLGLRALGADDDYTIPNRAFHSHGLNKPSLQKAKDEGIHLIVIGPFGEG